MHVDLLFHVVKVTAHAVNPDRARTRDARRALAEMITLRARASASFVRRWGALGGNALAEWF